MILIADFGKVSIYSSAYGKQVMSLNFTAPKKLQDQYNLQWEYFVKTTKDKIRDAYMESTF